MTGIGIARPSSRRARRRSRPHPGPRWNRPDALLFDVAMVIAVVAVPFLVGGRHPAGYAAISIAAIVACLAWLLRMLRVDEPDWTLGLSEGLLAVALLIGGVQMIVLPKHVIDAVSPRLYDLLPLCSGGPWSLGTWQTISLTPGETAVGFSIFLAQGILALVVFQYARSIEIIERLLVIVVVAAVTVALHGLIQFVGHEGKNFDAALISFHPDGGVVKAMFRSRNDFAGFLAIAAGPALWLSFRRRENSTRRDQGRTGGHRPHGGRSEAGTTDSVRVAVGLVTLVVISFAVFVSLSRGGAIALAAAIAIGCGMLIRSGHLRPKTGLAVLAAAAFVAIALEIHGLEQFSSRMETLVDENHQQTNFGRAEIWEAAWQTIRGFPLTGTGIGSHGDMSPITAPPSGFVHYVHAESSYLNLAVEAGLPGLILALAALVAAMAASGAVFLKGSDRERSVAAAIAAGLVAGALNGVGHFNWYVPAITTLLIVLGACAFRMAARHVEWMPFLRIRLTRSMATAMATAVVILLGFVTSQQIKAALVEPTWVAAVRTSRRLAHDRIASLIAEADTIVDDRKFMQQATAKAESLEAIQSIEPEPALAEKAKGVLERREATLRSLDEWIDLLEDVVTARPDHPRAWAAMATVSCDRFCLERLINDEPVLLPDLREIARTSWTQGKSHDVFLAWLKRTSGPRFKDLARAYDSAKRAVVNAPCSGDAWAVLAVLAPLESLDPELSRRCIEQALIVRPHDAKVLYVAYEQARLDGDADLASSRLRACFAKSAERLNGVLATLVPMYSAEEAVAILEPDVAGLRAIDAAWSRQSSADEMRPVRERRIAALLAAADDASAPRQSSQRCSLLCEAAHLCRMLGQNEQAAAILTSAITANPSHPEARLARIDLALALEDPGTAKQHLDWLLLRRPDAKAVQDRVNGLKKLRVSLASAPTAATTAPQIPPTP